MDFNDDEKARIIREYDSLEGPEARSEYLAHLGKQLVVLKSWRNYLARKARAVNQSPAESSHTGDDRECRVSGRPRRHRSRPHRRPLTPRGSGGPSAHHFSVRARRDRGRTSGAPVVTFTVTLTFTIEL